MRAIIVEGVLFAALIVVALMMVRLVIRQYTPVGTRLEQTANREAIERTASLTCTLHGAHDEREMVRLDSGELMCPQCYREAVGGAT